MTLPNRVPVLLAGALALLSLSVAGIACSGVAKLTGTPAFDCSNPPSGRIHVASGDLVHAFGTNVVQAEQTYGNSQILEVVGEASRVSRDDGGSFIALR